MKSGDVGDDDFTVDISWDDPKSAKKGKKTLKEKLEHEIASHEAKNWWNTFFIISCAFAVFNDPFFCYMNAIDSSNKCVTTDRKLALIYLLSRTFTDIIYLIDLLISKCQCCCSCCCRPRKNKRYQSCFRDLLSTLSRIYVFLPIAQILVIKMVGSLDPNSSNFLLFTSLQYALRIYYIYGSLKRRSIIDIARAERWLRPILGFVPFILAAHLFGAFWYLLATQSQIECWVNTRGEIKPDNSTCAEWTISSSKTSKGYVACDPWQHDQTYSSRYCNYNISRWEDLCPVKDPEPKTFDFGIYLYALQSDVVSHKEPLLRRVFQSFWWALRNLSSFGSNLYSSMDTLEIFFSALISITGMALFLVYLNARVQDSKETTKKHLLEKKKRLMKPDIDLWLFKNNLKGMETGETNKKKKKMETVIMDNIHKLEDTSDLNVQNILSVLPKKDKQRIIQCIFLASLKKASVLQTLDKKVLKTICQHLVPVTYTEDSYIIQEGKPIGKLLLFTQGSAITFSHGGTGTSNGFSGNKWLKKGDFYGEELLSWFRSPQYLDIPISTENVIAQEKVEAFVIRAGDLRNIFLKFWWLFSKKVDASQLKHWEHLAASSLGILLTTWRRRKAEKGSRALPDSSKACCCCFPHHANTKKTLWEKFSVKH